MSPILVATTPERVERLELVVLSPVVRVAILPVAVARFVVRVAILPVAVARFVVRVAIFHVAVARFELVVERPIVRLFILTSCAVFAPWSFWNAESTESAAVTVPDPATKLVRRDEREIFELKVFQSADERAPFVLEDARARESCCPERERPFGVPRVTGA